MKLLVTTSRSLLLFDTVSGEFRPVHRGAGLYYGIAATRRHYLVAARKRMVSAAEPAASERGEILIFNRRLEQVGVWQAPFALRDMHEIKWHRNHLWVSCSYDNMLAVRAPDGQWQQWFPLGEPGGKVCEEIQEEARDINHFNSLCLEGDELWLLAHNRGPSEILCFDLATRSLRQRRPLGRQAHNLWHIGGAWHTCSSADGMLIGEDGHSVPTGGFPRGIARLPEGWAVGVSALAERSQRDYSEGQLVIFDRDWRVLRRHSLPGEGLILDILPCPRGLMAVGERLASFLISAFRRNRNV